MQRFLTISLPLLAAHFSIVRGGGTGFSQRWRESVAEEGQNESTAPTLSPQPSTGPTMVPSTMPSRVPSSTPSNTPSLISTTVGPTMAPTSPRPSSVPSISPTIFPSFQPSFMLPTAIPTRTQSPIIETIDLTLEPFALVFALDENHTDWHPPSMVRAVQQVLVNDLRRSSSVNRGHDFAASMHDFRLQCGWIERKDVFEQVNETRLECTGHATFRAHEGNNQITEATLAREQASILQQEETQLSDLLSTRLGKSIKVIRVEIDTAILSRDEYDETEGPSSIMTSSTGVRLVALTAVAPWAFALYRAL